MKKIISLGILSTLLSQPLIAQADDVYTDSFKTYAKELTAKTGDTQLSQSILGYVQAVEKAEKDAGYLGKTLTLPQAIEVAPGVYTVVGSLIWHNPSNYGLNNNLTFMVFEDGVFVFNAGPNPAVAHAFHQQIKKVTDKPVKWVAVENSQGHAYLGASYWVDKGVKNLYSHSVANQDFHKGFTQIKKSWGDRVGHEITQTARDVSSQFTTFDKYLEVKVGNNETLQLINFGPGHTPGSTVVYVPSRNLVLPGDLAYNGRMLALFAYTNTFEWTRSFEKFMDAMPKDVIVIPGHGYPTNMTQVKTDTYDYLKFLQNAVQAHIKRGGNDAETDRIDQSAYKDKSVYEQTYRQNAVHVYKEITGADLGKSFE